MPVSPITVVAANVARTLVESLISNPLVDSFACSLLSSPIMVSVAYFARTVPPLSIISKPPPDIRALVAREAEAVAKEAV